MLIVITFLLFSFTVPLVVSAPAGAVEKKEVVSSIGAPDASESPGKFKEAAGAAVNQDGAGGVVAGTVYVLDSRNRRVQRFSPDGQFVSTFGIGVQDGRETFEICTKECRGGAQLVDPFNREAGGLERGRGIGIDQNTGLIYVTDAGRGNGSLVNVYSAKGIPLGQFGFGAINEAEVFQFCTPDTGCAQRPSFFINGQGGAFPENAIGGVAVDSQGHIYIANEGYRRVDVFAPEFTGATLTDIKFVESFGWGVFFGNPEFEVCTTSLECKSGIEGSGAGQFGGDGATDVAVDSDGNVYALDPSNHRVQKFNSTPEPVAAAFGATALEAIFGPEPQLQHLAMDSTEAPNHLLVSGIRASDGGKVAVAELEADGDNAIGPGEAHGEDLEITDSAGLAAAGRSLGGNVYVSTNTLGILRGVFVLNEPPLMESVSDITGTTATFSGSVVSNDINVTYHFEYSTDGSHWVVVPASDIDAGTAPGRINVELEATGLTGAQHYLVRLVQNRPGAGGISTSAPIGFDTLATPPAVRGSVAWPIQSTSATLNATLDPQNDDTSFYFEYGLTDCSVAPGACTKLPTLSASGGGARSVSQEAPGLSPATVYHYRFVAENSSGTIVGEDHAFETYATGRSLTSNRAFELVSPPETGGATPSGRGFGNTASINCFAFDAVADEGDDVVFGFKGATLPGLTANGTLDLYKAKREETGWKISSESASGAQSQTPFSGGCFSPDHNYSTLGTNPAPIDEGRLVVNGQRSNYIRRPSQVVNAACSPEPDGLYELAACGSEGSDPQADIDWISDGGSHIIYSSAAQLEPTSPGPGIEAIYDRSADGPNHLVSVLPDGSTMPNTAFYVGNSADGSTTLFSDGFFFIGPENTLYARVDNAKTIDVVGGGKVRVGTRLNCSSFSSGTITYKWLRNGAAIAGATNSSYTVTSDDAGKAVQCQIHAEEGSSAAVQASSAVVVEPAPAPLPPGTPFFIEAPAQSGTIDVPGPTGDRTLTCEPGSWTGSPTFGYQWYENGSPISGETEATLEIPSGSLTEPASYQCEVIATSSGGTTVMLSENRVTEPAPSPFPPSASASLGFLAVEYSGTSKDGRYVFYTQAGNIVSVDTETNDQTVITNAGNAKPVDISGDGSHVYFLSPSILASDPNGLGQEPEAGGNNLYVWERGSGSVAFVATVTNRDVEFSPPQQSLAWWNFGVNGPEASAQIGPATNAARATPDGSVLVFESRAGLTNSASAGSVEIYRFSSQTGDIQCVSCRPEGLKAAADAALQPIELPNTPTTFAPTSGLTLITNVSDDGNTVLFQTRDSLVPQDVNQTWDVYEWKLGQQAYLLSSGQSGNPSYLYGLSPDASDVFFITTDRLVPSDPSTVYSIYDARVGGGFDEPAPGEPCGEGSCQGPGLPPPTLRDPGSSSVQGKGNVQKKHKKHKKHKKKHKKHKKNGKHHKGGQSVKSKTDRTEVAR